MASLPQKKPAPSAIKDATKTPEIKDQSRDYTTSGAKKQPSRRRRGRFSGQDSGKMSAAQ
jgi:hypothetical protein